MERGGLVEISRPEQKGSTVLQADGTAKGVRGFMEWMEWCAWFHTVTETSLGQWLETQLRGQEPIQKEPLWHAEEFALCPISLHMYGYSHFSKNYPWYTIQCLESTVLGKYWSLLVKLNYSILFLLNDHSSYFITSNSFTILFTWKVETDNLSLFHRNKYLSVKEFM